MTADTQALALIERHGDDAPAVIIARIRAATDVPSMLAWQAIGDRVEAVLRGRAQ